MGGCAAVNCSNHSRNKFRMFRFPRNEERKRKWIVNCRRDGWVPGPRAELCSVHFEESQFEQHRADNLKKLKPNAVPTLFDVPNPPAVILSRRIKGKGLPKPGSILDNIPPVANEKGSASKKNSANVSLEDCTGEVIDDTHTLKLPNTLQFVQSELPLTEAENSSKLIGMFLFRQVISPNDTNHKCLLCTTKNTFRYLLDLEKHYSTVHELASQTFKAEFSENIVFVCVPPDVTEQTTLNSVCRFCDMTLKNLSEVRSHYPTSHNKVVRLVQVLHVMELSNSFFCSICSEMSKNFNDHHTHMKNAHRMQIFVSKFCNFITSRANRLKSHVKQKHANSTIASPQPTGPANRGSKAKLKCPVCQLFLNGKDNLDQHILLAHSVQTGPETWSCARCLQPCGASKEFINHVFNCTIPKTENALKPAKPTSQVYKCVDCSSSFLSEKDVKDSSTEEENKYDEVDENDDAQQEIELLKIENDSMRQEIQEFEKNNKAMTRVVLELEKHNKAMSYRLQELDKDNKVMSKRISDLERQNEDLKSKLNCCFSEEQLARMDKMKQLGTIERYIPALK